MAPSVHQQKQQIIALLTRGSPVMNQASQDPKPTIRICGDLRRFMDDDDAAPEQEVPIAEVLTESNLISMELLAPAQSSAAA